MSQPTARDYVGIHRVDAVCKACDHWQQLDLEGLVSRGFGNIPLVALKLRCTACDRLGHSIVVSGRSYPFGDLPP